MNFANKVSIFRILSVPFFVTTVLYYQPSRDFLRFISLAIFLLAVLSDAIDGYIARTRKESSFVGTILDPLADKLLLLSAFICVYIKPFPIKPSLWMVLLIISRDLILLMGSLLIYIIRGSIEVKPTRWGKLTTVFQMLMIMSLLLQLPKAFMLWYVALFFTVISGVDYINRGVRILNAIELKANFRSNN